MKYGIVVNGRVTEPVTIPSPLPEWAATPDDFLQKLYPDKSGWAKVSEDAVPGTIANGDGTFTAPVSPSPTPAPKTSEQILLERLEGIEAALAALQQP